MWLTTDVFPQLRASIIGWTEHNECDNIYAPQYLDSENQFGQWKMVHLIGFLESQSSP
ncbi:hypothetical protein [Nostoc sp.]|uniref:hypothetical protein n=1 Tax=Nostoc sp. TaxID=1180 RepID=UPI002FFB3EBF